MTEKYKLPDLVGMKFGKLTVLSRDGNIGRQRAWLCLCDCGNTKRTSGSSLKVGDTRSCGCLKKDTYINGIPCPTRTVNCIVCDSEFSYSSPNISKFCGDECGNKYRAAKGRRKYYSSVESRITNILCSTRSRCNKLGLECDIDTDYILNLLEKQEGRCAKTGIKFDVTERQGSGRNSNPYSPSLDQIIPSKGYTKDNIQLVCIIYNFCKHTWSDNDVISFANALINNQ